MQDFFVTNGLTFKAESDKETTDDSAEPYTFDIKSVDMIYNKDYSELVSNYKIPIFFKTPRSSEPSFIESGYVDNGRHIV